MMAIAGPLFPVPLQPHPQPNRSAEAQESAQTRQQQLLPSSLGALDVTSRVPFAPVQAEG